MRDTAERRTFSDDLARAVIEARIGDTRTAFPCPDFQAQPLMFARNVLGVVPWSRQAEIIEAVRDHDRVAVVSGHKIGKSTCAAILALWFYASWPDARVVMTSTTSRQVDQILWRELRMLRARSGRCVDCKIEDPHGLVIPVPCEHSAVLDGDQGELARTGLKSRGDFREIVGFTAREAEAVAGISGRHLLYLVDEGSGVPDVIFEAIEGNRAGGAKIVIFGNGTRNSGTFFDAFHSKSRHWKTLRVSSEETPNVVNGTVDFPGLATREWVQEKKDEWGDGSPIYLVRVKGGFATAEEGQIFSIHAVAESQSRWEITPEAGRLFIGIDPAGEAGTGDDTAIVARRGLRMLHLRRKLGLDENGITVEALDVLSAYTLPRETPVLVVDREGPIGSKLMIALNEYLTAHPGAFELCSARVSDRAIRKPLMYDRMRDELTANLASWVRDGGAILEDAKLEAELNAMRWDQQVNGKYKVTPKRILRKILGRSPDTYDALALAVWEPLSLSDAATADAVETPQSTAEPYMGRDDRVFDPYAAADIWRR